MVRQAAGEFPDLQNYVNLWPIDDVILTRLKYTSRRARQKEEAILAGPEHNASIYS